MKKTASVLLAILLCLSLMRVAVFAADTCIVAGQSELCGSFWSPNDTGNSMSFNGTLYEKVYTNVAEGDYQFKIVYNGQWYGAGNNGQDNVSFHVSSACDVKITYNPSNNDIKASGKGVEESFVTVNDIYAVGGKIDTVPNWLNGENWNAEADSNRTEQRVTGIYTIKYRDIPAGKYEFKFAADKKWTHNWGGSFVDFNTEIDAVYNGDNIVFTLSEQADVSLKLDLTEMDNKGVGAKFTIILNENDPPVEPTTPTEPSEPVTEEAFFVAGCVELCGVSWEPATESNKMIKGSDGIYTKVFRDVASGTYQLKVTIGSWDKSWGGSGENGNYEFTVDAVSDVEVKFDPAIEVVTVIVKAETVDPTNPSGNSDQLSKYRVVGNSAELGNWDAAFENGRMIETAPGVYTKTFNNLPAGDYEYKITDGTWDNCWGDNGANYKLKLETNRKVIFTFTLKDGNHSVTVKTESPGTFDPSVMGFVAATIIAVLGVCLLTLNKRKIVQQA